MRRMQSSLDKKRGTSKKKIIHDAAMLKFRKQEERRWVIILCETLQCHKKNETTKLWNSIYTIYCTVIDSMLYKLYIFCFWFLQKRKRVFWKLILEEYNSVINIWRDMDYANIGTHLVKDTRLVLRRQKLPERQKRKHLMREPYYCCKLNAKSFFVVFVQNKSEVELSK